MARFRPRQVRARPVTCSASPSSGGTKRSWRATRIVASSGATGGGCCVRSTAARYRARSARACASLPDSAASVFHRTPWLSAERVNTGTALVPTPRGTATTGKSTSAAANAAMNPPWLKPVTPGSSLRRGSSRAARGPRRRSRCSSRTDRRPCVARDRAGPPDAAARRTDSRGGARRCRHRAGAARTGDAAGSPPLRSLRGRDTSRRAARDRASASTAPTWPSRLSSGSGVGAGETNVPTRTSPPSALRDRPPQVIRTSPRGCSRTYDPTEATRRSSNARSPNPCR